MHKKMAQKEKEKLDDHEYLVQWKEKIRHIKEDELEEHSDIRKRCKNLQATHLNQMEIKKKKAEEDFRNDVENAFKTKLMLQNEQDEFLKYAEGWVGDYYKDGKDITPLLLDLKAYKKNMYSEK